MSQTYQYVNYGWDDATAAELDPVGKLIYRSNLLGSDQRITNTGGGNTSAKLAGKDPLTGASVQVLWVKGSGGDLRTSKKENFSSLYQDKLIALQGKYAAAPKRGPKTAIEDGMVGDYAHTTFNLNPRPSSIDTPLHSFVPRAHVDHTHPNAVISVAASKHGKELTKKIYGDDVIWTEWQRPGFDLGLQLQDLCAKHPQARGAIMGQHGLINWADEDKACYELSLELIDKAARYIAANDKGEKTFGGAKFETLPEAQRRATFVEVLPWLRGKISEQQRWIGTIQDDATVLRFVNSKDAPRLAELGTSCPDHFLRTKIKPLYVDWNPQKENVAALKEKLDAGLKQYRKDYASYYEKCKHADSPAMRNPNPTVVLIPGLGLIAWGKDKSESRVTAEFYNCADRGHARRGGDRRIHRAPGAGSLRHRVLAARGSEAQAHAGGEGTRAADHRRHRRRQRHRARGGPAHRPGRRACRVRRSSTQPRPRARPRKLPPSRAGASAWRAAAFPTADPPSASPATSPSAKASRRCSTRSCWPTADSTASP